MAIDAVTAHFVTNKDASSAVLQIPSHARVPDVIKHVQTKMKEKSVYVIAADKVDGEGKVTHGCFVSQVSSSALFSAACCFGNASHYRG